MSSLTALTAEIKNAGDKASLEGSTDDANNTFANGVAKGIANYVVTPGTGVPSVEIIETPTGLINGANATFTTSSNFDISTLQVFLNGFKLKKLADYNTIGNNTINLYISPLTGENLETIYIIL